MGAKAEAWPVLAARKLQSGWLSLGTGKPQVNFPANYPISLGLSFHLFQDRIPAKLPLSCIVISNVTTYWKGGASLSSWRKAVFDSQ